MARTILVGPDLAYGEEILAALDAARFPVTVAMWILQEERSKDWKIVISTPLYDKLGAREAYLKLYAALSGKGLDTPGDFLIRLESNSRPLIKALRKQYRHAASAEGMRLGGSLPGGIWIDDGYLYRVK